MIYIILENLFAIVRHTLYKEVHNQNKFYIEINKVNKTNRYMYEETVFINNILFYTHPKIGHCIKFVFFFAIAFSIVICLFIVWPNSLNNIGWFYN